MAREKVSLVLASGSPRRREILRDLKLAFEVVVPKIHEQPQEGETPDKAAVRLAEDKAREVASRRREHLVLAADTLVTVDGEILGKPADEADAREMLRKLSGKTHRVITGMSFILESEGFSYSVVSSTDVVFQEINEGIIDDYIRTGEYQGKAGAYAIQGHGSRLIKRYAGSYSNVVGLPITELLKFATSFGWDRLPWL